MDAFFVGPIPLSKLLEYKALPPLSEERAAALTRICSRDPTGWSEADVREEFISPLLAILGYEKGTRFSIERELPVALDGRTNFIDYQMTLWAQNFWLIEAKKPQTEPIAKKGKTESKKPRRQTYFKADDIAQAIAYAAHPQINATLAMLCDARRLTIYDRETAIDAPLLDIAVTELPTRIDEVRALVSPWQLWFFEKRRIVRLIDKVFDKEINFGRLEEFKRLVATRLDSKQRLVFDNWRQHSTDTSDAEADTTPYRNSDPAALVEGAFFFPANEANASAMVEALVDASRPDSFSILHRIFPDRARDMNDSFCVHALHFLIELEASGTPIQWLPSWLGDSLETALPNYIGMCLTHFEADPVRRNILLCASSLRRLIKASFVVDQAIWATGSVAHAVARYFTPEDDMSQILSNPGRQIILALDGLSGLAILRLLRQSRDRHGEALAAVLESQLRGLWQAEIAMLSRPSDYSLLLQQRGLGECHPTEAVDVVYDHLGDATLNLLNRYPRWRAYALAHHLGSVQDLAVCRSATAREWLAPHDRAATGDRSNLLAHRFFLEDAATLELIASRYGFPSNAPD